MLNSIYTFFSAFDATVIVPAMIFIIALFLEVKPGKAMMRTLYAGVGLTGFSWIINEFTPIVTRIVRQMVDNTRIKLPIVNIGWQAGSFTSFGFPVGLTFFVFGLITEFILFAVGVTKVLIPSNLWNNFGFMIQGTLTFYVAHNWRVSPGLSFFMLLHTLLLAEIQADRWSRYYKVENTTVCVAQNIVQTVPAILLDLFWNMLGFNKINLTPATFKNKFGVFDESTTLETILGIVVGILGNLKDLATTKAWGRISQFAIQLSAVMTIFPLVTNVFSKAFTPLTKQIDQTRKQNTSQQPEVDPVHDKRHQFLAVGDDVGYGESATIISGVILIPVTVAIAFLLPGNKAPPVVDLISLPSMVESVVAITDGDILEVITNGVIWFSLGLYVASWLDSTYTGTISQYGVAIPAEIVLVTSSNLMARPLNALVFVAFISQDPLWTSLCIIVYLVLLYILRKYRS